MSSDLQNLVVPEGVSPNDVVISKANEFISRFPTLQKMNGVPLLLHFDAKSGAYYIACHMQGELLAQYTDTDAVLDAEDEEYKLNRDLSLDKYAYKLMEEDALKGRTFEDLVIEYDMLYRPERPLKVYGGQHRIKALTTALEKGVSVVHGLRVYFNLARDQKVDIATVNNTSIAVPTDLLDRMQEDELGSNLRDWCQAVGLLNPLTNFADRSADDKPTVRIARTLITNFYLGIEVSTNSNKFYQPILCTSGPGIDSEYDKIRSKVDWNDPELIEMGKQFTRLHQLQMQKVRSRKKGKNSASARKAISLALVASWAYASGLFQRFPELLKNHYALGIGISPSDDPLNSEDLSKARLKGKDRETYRGLGTRNDPSELGRMFQLFLLQAEQGGGIDLSLANNAIKYYEGRKMTDEADKAVSKSGSS